VELYFLSKVISKKKKREEIKGDHRTEHRFSKEWFSSSAGTAMLTYGRKKGGKIRGFREKPGVRGQRAVSIVCGKIGIGGNAEG